jgi:hypothetical protein
MRCAGGKFNSFLGAPGRKKAPWRIKAHGITHCRLLGKVWKVAEWYLSGKEPHNPGKDTGLNS